MSTRCCALMLGVLLGAVWLSEASAQQAGAPMSAIDWLSQQPDLSRPVAQPVPVPALQAPTTQSGTAPTIVVTPLESAVQRRIGLLPFSVTGLKPDIWRGSDAQELARALKRALPQRLATGQELLITLLLAEADDLTPPTAGDDWSLARLQALRELGALEPALSLVSQIDPARTRSLMAEWLNLSLLLKSEAAPCSAIAQKPSVAPSEEARIFCTAVAGDFDTAALLYGTASALGLLTDPQDTLLARFLDPDLFEDDPLPRAPVRPDALTFRLFEAAGQPLPTVPLPRAFAVSDLGPDAGWKAQLEAAERLARAGVLPSNQLLGLYSDRKPAASGGIWTRVGAVQKFEAALTSGSADAVSAALPAMWRGMNAAGLEVIFSDMFAPELAKFEFPAPVSDLAHRILLLSRDYEAAIDKIDAAGPNGFLASVANGAPNGTTAPDTAGARAVVSGFSDDAAPSDHLANLEPNRLGHVMLQVLQDMASAGRGDTEALRRSLVDLRALGLEDTARRFALQFLILNDAA